jgi:Ni/Co efflux regulator RcnB
MKTLFIAALSAGLALAAPALADKHHPGGGGGGGGGRPAMHVQAALPAAHFRPATHAPRAAAHFRAMRAARPSAHRTARYGAHRTRGHAVHRAGHHAARHAVHHAVNHAVRHATHRRVAAHGGAFAKARRAVRAHRRFHVGVYHRPRGWYAHHWVIGNRLPRGWFVRDYWLTDWAIYGLWAPVDGLVWVRVGPDAMLIDPDTGEVVGVEYAVFF